MKKLTLLLSLFVLAGFSMLMAQAVVITGTVTSSVEGEGPIPGVSVYVKNTTIGTTTGINGEYSITVPANAATMIFTYVGMKQQDVAINGRTQIDVVLEPDVLGLQEVVVTALGITREKKTLPYAAQDVTEENLTISKDANIKTALAGKVAGVQIVGQAGSKLGYNGKIRIRGAISMTEDADPLYVIDGVPTSPDNVDMDNVASVSVLKGPNATALYGQRAEFGVVIITTKKATTGMHVEINSAFTAEKVAYLPNYQNVYGQGYSGDATFETFDYAGGSPWGPYPTIFSFADGLRYNAYEAYADESWGPKFDGQDYVPWYAWMPESPYYGQTAKWEANPDNIKNFYDTGLTFKNSVAISGGRDGFVGRITYGNLNQTGIIPSSTLNNHYIQTLVDYSISPKISIGADIKFSTKTITGDFDDGYSNQTSGSFNQWFARDIDTKILRELKDLKTPNGYNSNWNWWGPNYYSRGALQGRTGFEKPAFWYNTYFWLENYERTTENLDLVGNVHLNYQITDNIKFNAVASTNRNEYNRAFYLPALISLSAAPELYNVWMNSFGRYKSTDIENNFSGMFSYENTFDKISVDGFVGGNLRMNEGNRLSADMDREDKQGGLILPDVYQFSNSRKATVPSTYFSQKEVRSIYSKLSLGYDNMLFLDATYRRDWSSALPSEKNGYGYPSVGGSFIFSELIADQTVFSFGKLRAGWAQVGNDLAAYRISQIYPLSGQPYQLDPLNSASGLPFMYTTTQIVNPDIKPALNTSFEVGTDLKFFYNRVGLSFTYYKETRENEIIPVSLTRATGYDTYLTNAGKSERSGIEVVVDFTPVKTNDFVWTGSLNYGQNTSKILELPGDLTSLAAPGGNDAFAFVYVIHELGNEWGQLRGTAIKRIDGEPVINASGTYATESAQYLGSVLPDFTGGFINNFSYKGLNLLVSIDYQKGGKFFSLSEMWGEYSGLYEETAVINDRGFNVRDDVAAGGGVHVTGVDAGGAPVDMYVDGYTYYSQWYANKLAEPFVHDASFIKLRDVGLSYQLPKSLFANTFIGGVNIGFIARNVAMLAVAKDNVHGWDPSEMSTTYGESGQLPGTRSYGVNIKLTF